MFEQDTYTIIIKDQTARTLWEVENVMDCAPDTLWNTIYCDAPIWKHIYHMLHSLDLWFINPRDTHFAEPSIHQKGMNDLDYTDHIQPLSRTDINGYYKQISSKIINYTHHLKDEDLLENPSGCEYCRFTLILAQFRHLHTHMGMLMGFIIAATGQWPRVVGLEGEIPTGDYTKFC